MAYDYHVLWGLLAVFIGIASYVPYYRDVLRGTTKPHPFTWLVWVLMDFTVLAAQLTNGAGPGAWATAITAILASGVVLLSFRRGEKRAARLDWWFFGAGLLGIVLWAFTSDALYAIVIAASVNVAAMIPTIRKSYARPHEETMALYILAVLKWIPAILAMQSFSVVTVLYPVALIATNSVLISVLFTRRRK